MPIVVKFTRQPASARTDKMSSANVPASKSPSLVSATIDPAYGRSAATNLSCWPGLIRRCANRCSSSRFCFLSRSAITSNVLARSLASEAFSFAVAICRSFSLRSRINCCSLTLARAAWAVLTCDPLLSATRDATKYPAAITAAIAVTHRARLAHQSAAVCSRCTSEVNV